MNKQKQQIGKTKMTDSETATSAEETTVQPESRPGLGFDFFSPATPKQARLRYWFHFSIYVILMCLAIWPMFSFFNRIEPYVLGMPFNMFWSSFVIGLVAVNTYFLYRFDVGPLTASDEQNEG